MTVKRFTLNSVLNFDFGICDYGEPIGSLRNTCELLNELHEENDVLKQELKTKAVVNRQYEELQRLKKENEQLKEENNKLHQKIFEMRTNIALERTEISRQHYTGKKNEKEYLDAKEFLNEIERW